MSQPLDNLPERFNRFTALPSDLPDSLKPPIAATDIPQISAVILHQLLNTAARCLVLIDVRYPHEYACDHLPGATLIPFAEIKQAKGIARVKTILTDWQAQHPDRAPHLIVYCTAGIRSAKALRFLQTAGIYGINLEGGMQAWKALPESVATSTLVSQGSRDSSSPLRSIDSSPAHCQPITLPNTTPNTMTQVQHPTRKKIAAAAPHRKWLYASLGVLLLAGGLLTWLGSRYIYNPDRLRPMLEAGVPLELVKDVPIVGDAVKSAELPQITVDELQQKIDVDAKDYVLIDVRSTQEYNEGSIPGAISVPLTDIETGKGIEQVKSMLHDRQLIAYCSYSYRSGKALVRLEEAGIKGIQVRGGIVTWSETHHPTVVHQ